MEKIESTLKGYNKLKGGGSINRAVNFVVNQITPNVRQRIEEAGGSVELAELTLDLTHAVPEDF